MALLPKTDFADSTVDEFVALRRVTQMVEFDLGRLSNVRDHLAGYTTPEKRAEAIPHQRSVLPGDAFEEIYDQLKEVPSEKQAVIVLELLDQKISQLETYLGFLRHKKASLAEDAAILTREERLKRETKEVEQAARDSTSVYRM